jgi:lipid A ethanolaminephosphotransferase
LTVLFLATACATHFMQVYGVYLTPGMLRNVVHSETSEAADLIGRPLFLHVLLEGVAPAALVWLVRFRKFPMGVAAARRAGVFALSLCLLSVAVLLAYQDLAPLFRNQKEARYLITPANYLYSLARVAFTHVPADPGSLMEVGIDARRSLPSPERRRPVLFVIVVGETARSANWGLNGYARQTTPELSRLDVINFPTVNACGSDTETSLPCMFSAVGRRDYDEYRIRNSESLLHVLQRAGFNVLWRDNQTGCKGVCAGLPYEQADALNPKLCARGECFDEVLLDDLPAFAKRKEGDKVVVLHQMGNHGPAYYHRYPERFRQFTPTCDTSEIRQCSVAEIVNSYDNALLYTDYFLSRTIKLLQEQEDHDTAMIYVSDHGESLGEHGLFLHGIPYSIAPDTQTRVPMVLWLSPGMRSTLALDEACIRGRAERTVSHDYLFHTVLGLLAVETKARNPAYDLADGCRKTGRPGMEARASVH